MEKDYTVGESYILPSKGLIYDQKITEGLMLRSMTARDEMKRLSPTTQPLKTLADIIEGCIMNKPAVHVYDMAWGDYVYLLYKLRIVSYGADYKILTKCPHCDETFEVTADLDKLVAKPFDLSEFEALRTVTLPRSHKEVSLRFKTPRIDEAIKAKAKEMKRLTKGSEELDFSLYAQLLYAIEKVDGKALSSVDFDYFFEDLSAMDLQKLLNSIDALDSYVGVDETFTLTCPHCQNDFATFFRFGPEFFRPSNI